ncbi:MAG: helix-turn-helix transcriptional regulator [Treponema sp.]|jgi:transcriptional regulator with XRE-family HTH domain|nr:helix-turn-helix transcriptional regulator [Treponema sp.]
MYKKMLGDTIYRLRKEKGLSQSELGEFVGVSNKAVSKWETYEANPDITLLPLLAQALGVTTDELLTDIKAEKNDPKPKETKVFGVHGMVIETPEEYEFVSDKKTKNDLPYLHIHFGKQIRKMNVKARGVVAIGINAKGVISIGLFSRGIISFGIFSLGLLTIGTFGLGLVAVGSIVLGVIAVGAIAAGLVSFGAVAMGFLSYGTVAVGYYAHTVTSGYALGKYTFFH